jgi:hypothetical protein
VRIGHNVQIARAAAEQVTTGALCEVWMQMINLIRLHSLLQRRVDVRARRVAALAAHSRRLQDRGAYSCTEQPVRIRFRYKLKQHLPVCHPKFTKTRQ